MVLTFIQANSALGVVLMVAFLVLTATVGIAIMAIVFSALLQFVFGMRGDRDEELLAAAEPGADA